MLMAGCRRRIVPVAFLGMFVLAGCGVSIDWEIPPAGEATAENAMASYVWLGMAPDAHAVGGIGQELVTVPGRNGVALAAGLGSSAAAFDDDRGGRGLRLLWWPEATVQERTALADRAVELGLTEFFFLGPIDLWPSCSSTPDDCTTVAEAFLPDSQLDGFLAEYLPDRP